MIISYRFSGVLGLISPDSDVKDSDSSDVVVTLNIKKFCKNFPVKSAVTLLVAWRAVRSVLPRLETPDRNFQV